MSNTNTGGPAFPDGTKNEWGHALNSGMTLRDYFAGKAMQSYMHEEIWSADIYKLAAKCSYEVADAMLKARDA
jgi:hypothetical protein